MSEEVKTTDTNIDVEITENPRTVAINKETVSALARLLVTVAAGVCTVFGWKFDADILFNVVITVGAFAAIAYTWWKNNNVTEGAQAAQEILDEIKKG